MTGERDRILTPGRAVPVEHVTRRGDAKGDARGPLHCGPLPVGALGIDEGLHVERQLGDLRLATRVAVHAPRLRHCVTSYVKGSPPYLGPAAPLPTPAHLSD